MKIILKKKETRYERKWELNNNFIDIIFLKIFRSNFFFKEIYKKRTVNSIYFDDANFQSIHANLDGVNNKTKYRIRWYGDSNKIIMPVFEKKIKDGYITTKSIFEIKGLNKLDFNYEGLNKINDFVNSYLNFKTIKLFPIISTHYDRYYFLSANKYIRGTLDTNIGCKHLYARYDDKIKKNFIRKIFELKYETHFDDYVKQNCLNFLPRISRSSKYVFSALEKTNFYTI